MQIIYYRSEADAAVSNITRCLLYSRNLTHLSHWLYEDSIWPRVGGRVGREAWERSCFVGQSSCGKDVTSMGYHFLENAWSKQLLLSKLWFKTHHVCICSMLGCLYAQKIITPILPTVKMLSLGERLAPPPPPPTHKKKKKKKKKKRKKFWIITCTMIWVCHHYYRVFFSLIYSC